ncbi:aminotransferase class V-fold PLP-dependent enzyme [Pontibacillus yanchengensis]|uniref:Aminotransferase class V-fold PLP-dependent enzyme n=1 Tax=Pontibacillus yanchengensis TaxID=462910 RepID=A0ACC7VES3_9BACI|nr:cysteine desulfurase family protein [Pontibacillus yanchengensis]MYL53197.1 aminotransferase class V-fold PLP-dependent enzyme [Pontibacillus yanchengensis]
MIYFDNSATTKPYPEVLQSFHQVADTYYGNPSSIHRFGSDSERLLNQSKKQAAQLLSIDPEEIIFTSGGTEGNNLAIKGIALQHQNRGKHIITSSIEHPSVLEACKALEGLGFEVTYLQVNEEGIIDLSDLEKSIREDTILISIMHVNNELGSIQPIQQIGKIANRYPKLYFHVDYVQGLGKVPLDFHKNNIDLCTMSSHKIHGLKGTGILFVKKNTSLFPLLHGGSQEASYRAGTENLPGIVSMVKALRMTLEHQRSHLATLQKMHEKIRVSLEEMSGVIVNTPENAAPHILNFSLPGFKPEVVIHALGEQGVFISTKSACSSKDADESAILIACGANHERASSALRISLSYFNTNKEVDSFLRTFRNVIDQLSEVMG